jgi:2-desacetyl-2-hydroxyethyl bacteriochlorophyllide A dehydrogenase
MKAAVLQDHRTISVQEIEKPVPSAEEVLIQVRLGGICGSDHSVYHGKIKAPLPVVPGHEAVGTVAAGGDRVSNLELGQRVTIQPNFSCHRCELCAAGYSNICASKIRLGVDINGVFADYVKVPARYVWPIPEDLDDEVAIFAEPLAVCVHAMKRRSPRKDEQVLIFGAGVMGLLTLQLAVGKGASVTAVDLSQRRLALAHQLGAAETICSKTPVDAGSMEAHFNKFDLIYETSGALVALDQAIRLAACHGTIVVLGLPGKENPVCADQIVRKELQILGSMIYTDEFPETIGILQKGQIDTAVLTTGTVELTELDEALRGFGAPERVKTLVKI